MIDRIIYFRYLPLTKKIYEDFYMDYLCSNGIDVEYWYLPFVIDVPVGIEQYKNECVKTINSYKELKAELKKVDKQTSLFVSIQTYGWPVLRLFWVMSRYNCRMSVFGKNTLPPAPPKAKINKMFNLPLRRIIQAIQKRTAGILKEIGIIKSYDVLFLSGLNGINGFGQISTYEKRKSQRFLVNSDDYDRSLSLKNGDRILPYKYIVFLDQCMPLHPDIAICKFDVMDADVYYKELNSFFKLVENHTHMQVVIAAHPKSLIYKSKDFFDGRQVIFGRTPELIRDSSLVFAHDSTSIGYAVCFNKPIVSLTSDALQKYQSYNHKTIVGSSQFLGTNLMYINKFCADTSSIFDITNYSIDKDKYKQYKYDFLTNPETEDEQSSELILKAIRLLK